MSGFQERIIADPSDRVVSEQSEIFVSTDDDGDVIIHQYRWDEGDVLIFVCPQNALAVSKAILKAAGIDPDATAREVIAERASANERQRRHREKLRDSHADNTVTVTAKLTNELDDTDHERSSSAAS